MKTKILQLRNLIKHKLATDENLKFLVTGGFVASILSVFQTVSAYVILLLITHNYGADKYGEYQLALGILFIAIILPRFGLHNALVRIASSLFAKNKLLGFSSLIFKLCIFSLFVGLIVNLLLQFFATEIATLFNLNNSDSIKNILWSMFPIILLTLLGATMQGFKLIIAKMLIETTLLKFFIISLLLISIFFNASGWLVELSLVEIYVIAVCLSLFCAVFIYWPCYHQTYHQRNQKVVQQHNTEFNFSNTLVMSTPMLISGIFGTIMMWTDVIMLGIYTNVTDVGIYSAISRLASVGNFILVIVNIPMATIVAQTYSLGDSSALGKIVRQSTKIIFFLTLPIVVIVLIFPTFILNLLGDEFQVGVYALILLTMGQFMGAMIGSVGVVMNMTNYQNELQKILVFATIVNLFLNWLLIPIYGINGAAFATMVSMFTWNLLTVFFIRKKLGFWTFYNPFVKISNIVKSKF